MLFHAIRTLICLVIIATVASENDFHSPRKCPVRNCTDVESLVWALDGHTCRVFRNGCEYSKTSCEYWQKEWPEMRRVTQARCKKMCNQICIAAYAPLCAKYKADYRTFGNSCLLNAHVCFTGELYVFVEKGECQSTD